MTRGKICAQAAHAVLGLYKEIEERGDPVELAQWASMDFKQETYKANSYEDLTEAYKKAQTKGMRAYLIHDAGRT